MISMCWRLILSCLRDGAFEKSAVPVGKFRTGFIGALAKIENRLIGRRGDADIAVLQDEFTELAIPMSRGGANGLSI